VKVFLLTVLMDLRGEEYQFHFQRKVLFYTYPGKLAGPRRTLGFYCGFSF